MNKHTHTHTGRQAGMLNKPARRGNARGVGTGDVVETMSCVLTAKHANPIFHFSHLQNVYPPPPLLDEYILNLVSAGTLTRDGEMALRNKPEQL